MPTPVVPQSTYGSALDAATGTLYRANLKGNTVSYSNLDGSGSANLNTNGATVDEPGGGHRSGRGQDLLGQLLR